MRYSDNSGVVLPGVGALRWDKVLWLGVLASVLLLLQANRFFAIGGVNPDLVLIGAVLALFLPLPRSVLFLLGGWLLVLGLIWIPFWFLEIAVLLVVIIPAALARRFLTGRPFPDFLITLAAAALIVHALVAALGGGHLSPTLLFGLLYNVAVGVVAWGVARSPTFSSLFFSARRYAR